MNLIYFFLNASEATHIIVACRTLKALVQHIERPLAPSIVVLVELKRRFHILLDDTNPMQWMPMAGSTRLDTAGTDTGIAGEPPDIKQ